MRHDPDYWVEEKVLSDSGQRRQVWLHWLRFPMLGGVSILHSITRPGGAPFTW